MTLIALKLFNNMMQAKLRPEGFIKAGIRLYDRSILGGKFHKKYAESSVKFDTTKLKQKGLPLDLPEKQVDRAMVILFTNKKNLQVVLKPTCSVHSGHILSLWLHSESNLSCRVKQSLKDFIDI